MVFQNKKKTTFSWIILIFGLFLIIKGIIPSLMTFFQSISNPSYLLFTSILNLITYIVGLIFLYKLFQIKNDVFLWLNIVFVSIIIKSLVNPLMLISLYRVIKDPTSIFSLGEEVFGFGVPGPGLTFLVLLVMLAILIMVWFAIYKHLRKAQSEKSMDFS